MNRSPAISHKSWYKHPLWIVVILFMVVLICANGWLSYKDSHPQSYINFTQYEPTKIVDNLKIQSKTLNVWNSSLFSPVTVFMPYSVDVNLSLGAGSYIGESQDKATQFDITCGSVNVTCGNKTTPKGQSYRLVLTRQPSNLQSQPLVYDKLTTQQVTFSSRSGTGFIIHIQSDHNALIADTDWGDMIDSFTPTTFNDLQVKHLQPGP